jgi:hypothetical protein
MSQKIAYVTGGMGGIGIEHPLGVAFYIYLYELLGTKYHLTEFNKLWFKDLSCSSFI